jgi:hypothetical protein
VIAGMTERQYWAAPEFRVSREIAGLTDKALRFLWCDGFRPDAYLVDDIEPCTTGRTWNLHPEFCQYVKAVEAAFQVTVPVTDLHRSPIDEPTTGRRPF